MSADRELAAAIKLARQRNNREMRVGYLGRGDGSGDTRDRSIKGNYWVRFVVGGAYTQPVSYPLNPNANIETYEGFPVLIGYDESGRQEIRSAYREGFQAAGGNPLALNPLDKAAHNYVDARLITQFYWERHSDTTSKPMTVSVFPNIVIRGSTTTLSEGLEIDLTSFVPSAGLRRVVVVLWKTDNTLEAFGSTAASIGDPLMISEIQDAVNQRSTGSIPICAWRMVAGQTALSADADQSIELRQIVNVVDAASSTPEDYTPLLLTGWA